MKKIRTEGGIQVCHATTHGYFCSFLFIDFRMTEEQVERHPTQEEAYAPQFLHRMTYTSRTTNERRNGPSE